MGMVKCFYLRTCYTSDKNGYTVNVYKFIDGDNDARLQKNDTFVATGTLLGGIHAAVYELQGNWITSDRDGKRQFTVVSYTERVRNDERSIKEFLLKLDGSSEFIAREIYAKYGNDTFTVLDRAPEQILALPFVTKEKGKRLMEAYIRQRTGRELMELLLPFGISIEKSMKILQADRGCLEKIRQNPYWLCGFSISFKVADELAHKFGLYEELSPERLHVALSHGIYMAENQTGSCACDYQALEKYMKKTAPSITSGQLQVFLRSEVNKDFFVLDQKFVRQKMLAVEQEVASRIVDLVHADMESIARLDEKIDAWERKVGIKLHEEQRKAVYTALSNGFVVITGGPGCGKTTIVRAIVEIWDAYGKNNTICQLCPTGKAAQRMYESTGLAAQTIHSRLEIFDSEDYEGTDRVINDGLLICDEISMLDIYAAKALLSHVKNGTRVIFVGDIYQLPSVGAGAVLRDIIASHVVPVVMLTKTYRQAQGSHIISNAQKIKEGRHDLDFDKDVPLVLAHKASDYVKYVLQLYMLMAKKYGRDNIMVLSPLHYHVKNIKGYCPAVDDLNRLIQALINPPSIDKKELGIFRKRITGFTDDTMRWYSRDPIKTRDVYRVGDPVMQTRNVKGIANGDIGKILDITKDGLVVQFPQAVKTIKKENLNDLELGYAMSIHKSQGSEAPCVIMALPDIAGAKQMLQRNLMYTGLTRAKEVCYVVSNHDAINLAINNEATNIRITHLKELLIKEDRRRNTVA